MAATAHYELMADAISSQIVSSTISAPQENCPQERRFIINGFTYAAQLWAAGTSFSVDNMSNEAGSNKAIPVIALHGWLDNSASFDILAPQLTSSPCLAIDLAGHGLSDHHDGLTDYPVWSEVGAIYAIADQMGWEQFALVGHSRGAMMALLVAAVYPERITHFVAIDALLPPVVKPEAAVSRMVDSLGEIQRRINRKLSLYPSYQSALKARCASRFAPVTQETAAILARRGLRELEGRYHWHADGKLWAPANVALSEATLQAYIANISAPVLLLLGKQGMLAANLADDSMDDTADDTKSRLTRDVKNLHQQAIQQLSAHVEFFDDGHFLHMEVAARQVAATINTFLSR